MEIFYSYLFPTFIFFFFVALMVLFLKAISKFAAEKKTTYRQRKGKQRPEKRRRVRENEQPAVKSQGEPDGRTIRDDTLLWGLDTSSKYSSHSTDSNNTDSTGY